MASCEQLAHLSAGPWCLSAPWGTCTQMKRQYNDNPKTIQRQCKDNAKTRHRRIPHTCQLALGCAYPCWDPGGRVSERAAGILSRDSDELSTVNCNEAVLQLCPTIGWKCLQWSDRVETRLNSQFRNTGIHNLETREFTIKAKL